MSDTWSTIGVFFPGWGVLSAPGATSSPWWCFSCCTFLSCAMLRGSVMSFFPKYDALILARRLFPHRVRTLRPRATHSIGYSRSVTYESMRGAAGRLDEVVVQVRSVTLGQGKPLFPRLLTNPPLQHPSRGCPKGCAFRLPSCQALKIQPFFSGAAGQNRRLAMVKNGSQLRSGCGHTGVCPSGV